MNLHIVIASGRSKVYYFCPDCRDVFGILKADPADCPECGRKGFGDIFSEMAVRVDEQGVTDGHSNRRN